MQPKYYVDEEGNFIGTFQYAKRKVLKVIDNQEIEEENTIDPGIPENAIEVTDAPEDARQKWDHKKKKWKALVKPRTEKIIELLTESESNSKLARAIEEIILNIVSDGQTPLSSQVINWAADRDTKRKGVK